MVAGEDLRQQCPIIPISKARCIREMYAVPALSEGSSIHVERSFQGKIGTQPN